MLRAAWDSALETRESWQGTYTGTLLSNVQPGIFSEELYFVGTFVLLTALIACFLTFFSVVFGRLGMDRTGRWTLGCLAVTLMIQFMPDAGEAFFWFNGGIGNTFIYSLMALAAALLVRLAEAKGPRRGADGGAVCADGAFGRRQLWRRAAKPVHAGGVPGVDDARAASAALAFPGTDGPAARVLCVQHVRARQHGARAG